MFDDILGPAEPKKVNEIECGELSAPEPDLKFVEDYGDEPITKPSGRAANLTPKPIQPKAWVSGRQSGQANGKAWSTSSGFKKKAWSAN